MSYVHIPHTYMAKIFRPFHIRHFSESLKKIYVTKKFCWVTSMKMPPVQLPMLLVQKIAVPLAVLNVILLIFLVLLIAAAPLFAILTSTRSLGSERESYLCFICFIRPYIFYIYLYILVHTDIVSIYIRIFYFRYYAWYFLQKSTSAYNSTYEIRVWFSLMNKKSRL